MGNHQSLTCRSFHVKPDEDISRLWKYYVTQGVVGLWAEVQEWALA